MTSPWRGAAFCLAAAAMSPAVGCNPRVSTGMSPSRPNVVPPVAAPIPEPPSLPQSLLSPPTLTVVPTAVASSASEPRVTIDTHGAEIDVRQVLGFLAHKGGMSLLYAPDVAGKVRLQLVDVPASEALHAVLSLAHLTLEGASAAVPTIPAPSVVFYQLPVNVDSLSAESIMKRFGVGREIAELLVGSRPNRP
jgi:hypothetical protein